LALVAALHKLPRRQRDAVVLRYVTGLSEAETATSLGVSVNTVRTHVNRGLAALRRRLGDDFNEEDTLASAGC
jgi:RNA polymerase sigma factor (sigma-70 family)